MGSTPTFAPKQARPVKPFLRHSPASVNEVLNSPGQPLEATTREFMEPRFGHDFSRIRIHTDAPAARAAAELGADAFTAGHHIAFARGRFRPGASDSMRLVAHELTHTIQQTGTSPYIALSPSKNDGSFLGTDRSSREILVKRDLGALEGYDDRLQAIAVARLAKAEPAAVAMDKDGKWHAFETASGADVDTMSAKDPEAVKVSKGSSFKQMEVLPPLSGIAQYRQEVDDLKGHLARLDKLEEDYKKDPEFRESVKGADPPFLEAVAQERDKSRKRLTQANQTRAALVFGVNESEISVNVNVSDRQAGKINLTGDPGKGATSDARHGPVLGQPRDFSPDTVTAFDIDAKSLDNPEHAQGSMFHEVSHLRDYKLAQDWVKLYQQETKRIFVAGPNLRYFYEWIDKQVAKKPPRLSAADAELIKDQAADANATTEARANVRTFLLYFQSGVFNEAKQELVNYAKALPPGTGYATPPSGSLVLAELTKEIKAAYGKAGKPEKSQFEAAMAAAKKANSTAWVSQIDLGK